MEVLEPATFLRRTSDERTQECLDDAQGSTHLAKEIECLGLTAAVQAAGVSVRTACKWQRRHAAQGDEGLPDGSSRPHVGFLRHLRRGQAAPTGPISPNGSEDAYAPAAGKWAMSQLSL